MSQNLHSSWRTLCYSSPSVNDLESTPDYHVVKKKKYQNRLQSGHVAIAHLII